MECENTPTLNDVPNDLIMTTKLVYKMLPPEKNKEKKRRRRSRVKNHTSAAIIALSILLFIKFVFHTP